MLAEKALVIYKEQVEPAEKWLLLRVNDPSGKKKGEWLKVSIGHQLFVRDQASIWGVGLQEQVKEMAPAGIGSQKQKEQVELDMFLLLSTPFHWIPSGFHRGKDRAVIGLLDVSQSLTWT